MGEQIFIFEMKENIKNFLELTENVKIEADLVEDWVGNRQKAQIKQEGYSNVNKNSSGFITFKISGVSQPGRQDRTMKGNYLSYGMDLMDLMDGEGQLQEEIMREETEELYTIQKFKRTKNKRNAKKQENVGNSYSGKVKFRETQNPGNSNSGKETQNPGNSKSRNLKIGETQNLGNSKSGKLKIRETQNPGNPKSGKLKIRETQNPGNSKSGKPKIRELKIRESQNPGSPKTGKPIGVMLSSLVSMLPCSMSSLCRRRRRRILHL